MAALLQRVLLLSLTGVIFGQAQNCSVKAQLSGPDGSPLEYGVLELRANGAGHRAAADASGRVLIPAVSPGKYELSIEGGGFLNLSRSIGIIGDTDLGSIKLENDPDVIHAGSLTICCGTTIPPSTAPVRTHPPRVLRGVLGAPSVFKGQQVEVQVACAEKRPGMNQRPPWNVARTPLHEEGYFELPVPDCFGPELAHRELLFSLKDQRGKTLALLLPQANPSGYFQSRLGIQFSPKAFIEEDASHATTFFPEFTDNRPLRAELSVRPSKDHFSPRDTILVNYRLKNTSAEALSVRRLMSDVVWTIKDKQGKLVPFRLAGDRLGNLDGEHAGRVEFLFPGESISGMVNVSFRFDLEHPGTYQVTARLAVGRPELPGAEQVVSAPAKFAVDAK